MNYYTVKIKLPIQYSLSNIRIILIFFAHFIGSAIFIIRQNSNEVRSRNNKREYRHISISNQKTSTLNNSRYRLCNLFPREYVKNEIFIYMCVCTCIPIKIFTFYVFALRKKLHRSISCSRLIN